MRNLARPLLRLLGRDDRGAVAVLVAVLVAGGVLLGMGAMVIDVGQIYQNRAELQNGADSAALAAARQCALGTCAQASAVSTALTYAASNASALTGHKAGVTIVCGYDSQDATALNPCSDYPAYFGAGLTDCPKDPASGSNFIDVLTATKLPNGSTLLPPVFARTLLGASTYDGTNVKACAQAEWGHKQYGTGIGFTISACEWATATDNNTKYWTGLPAGSGYSSPWPSLTNGGAAYDQSLLLHSGAVTSGSCPADPAFADAPGAFGWTLDQSGTCTVQINNNTYGTNTGVSASGDCQDALLQAYTNRTPVQVPVYTSVVNQGNNTVYTLTDMASFIITGFRVPSLTETDWVNPGLLCGAPDVCIDGFFIKDLGGGGGGGGNYDLGTEIAALTG